jgi:sigma-E factor negative regulatory protein RseC
MYNLRMSKQSHQEPLYNSLLRRHEGEVGMSADSAAGMTIEKARVISVEPSVNGDNGALWVETFQQSTCGSCEAKGACGQGVLGRWLSRGTHCIRVLCDKGQADFFTAGQWVEIAVPDGVVLKASLMAYLLPLLSMMTVAIMFDSMFQDGSGGDFYSLIGGIVGFIVGLVLVRLYERNHLNSRQNQPQLLGLSSND